MSDLAQRLQAGERRALAKAITLVESTRADHREQADALLTELMPATGQALRLDHLYLRTGFQGLGIGEWVLHWAKSQAREQQRDIALTALVESDANRFYLRHGFVLEGEEGVDLHCRWRVASEAAC